MKRLCGVLHDAWCEITKRCEPSNVQVVQTPMIEWLKEQEQAANQSAEHIRERRRHRSMEENWRREKRNE